MVVILSGLPTGGVLGEEHLDYLFEFVERTQWQRIKPIRGHTFQTRRENGAHERIIAGVDYHFVSKMSDVLNWVAHSGVVVEGQSRELPRELHSKISLERGESETLTVEGVDRLLNCNFAS